LEDYSYVFHTNSLGLRDGEISIEKPDGVFRVLVVGDSYVEGWGAQDNEVFTEVAEKNLQDTGLNIEVINAGVASYSPTLELDWLRLYGMSLNPDLVIMMVDVNDFHDDFLYGGWERYFKTKDELFPEKMYRFETWPPDENIGFKKAISFSKVLSTFYKVARGRLDLNSKVISRESLILGTSIFSQAQNWDDYEKAFSLLNQNIYLTSRLVKTKGADFAVTTSSRGAYHNETEWSPGRTSWYFEEGRVYEPEPINIIKKFDESKSIEYIDVFDALQSSKVHPLYYSVDMHWTPVAQKIVGERVSEFVKTKIEKQIDLQLAH
jgi:hypothetical protein